MNLRPSLPSSSAWPWKLVVSICLLLFVTVPGSAITPFDGLPLNPWEGVLFVATLLVIWSGVWTWPGKYRYIMPAVLLGATLWQIVGWASVPYGWSICLKREIKKEMLSSPCEPSPAHPAGDRTDIVSKISYEQRQFPLHFINNVHAFNLEGDRVGFPYSFTATGFFQKQDRDVNVTTNINEGVTVDFNNQTRLLMPDDKMVLSLRNAEQNRITIRFTTADRTGNALQVQTDARPMYRAVSAAAEVAWVPVYTTVSWIFTVLLIIFSGVHFSWLFTSLPKSVQKIYSYTGAWVAGLALLNEHDTTIFTLVLVGIILSLTHLSRTWWRRSWIIPVLLLFGAAAIYVAAGHPPNEYELLEGENDPLTHESAARATALAHDWKTFLVADDNRVFHHQPLYRYLAGAVHRLFGEAMWSIYTVQTFLFMLTAVVASRLIWRQSGRWGVTVYVTLLVYILAHNLSFVRLASTAYQEALGLPFLFLSILWTIKVWLEKDERAWIHFYLGLLWGATAMTRTDFLPGIIALVVYGFARTWPPRLQSNLRRLGIAIVAGLIIAPLFILIRNVAVAGTWAIIPSSGYTNFLPQFKAALPHVTAPTFGARTIFFDLPYAYRHELVTFLSTLWESMMTWLIGSDPVMQTVWILTLAIGTLGLILNRWPARVALLILFTGTLTPMFFHLFFDHTNDLPATSHYTYMPVLMLALVLGTVGLNKYDLKRRLGALINFTARAWHRTSLNQVRRQRSYDIFEQRSTA